jgi:hypothetical protein
MLKNSKYENHFFRLKKLTFKKAQKIISQALDLIQKNLEPLLQGQQKVEDFRYRIYKLNTEVDQSILTLRGGVLRKKTPIMFSSRFFLNLRRALYFELPRQFRISWPDKDFFIEEAWVIILQIFTALAIALGIRQSRAKLQDTPKWRFMAQRPYASGLTISLTLLTALYVLMPAVWRLLLMAVAGISLSRFASGIIADRWKRRFIYGLVAVVIINQLLEVIGLPLTFVRVYVFVITLAGFLLLLWRSVNMVQEGSSTFYGWVLGLAAFFLLIVFIAEFIGQAVFAMEVFDAAIRSIFFVLLGWMMITLFRGGLELVVNNSVFQRIYFIKENADLILRRLMLLVQIYIWGFVFANLLVDWEFTICRRMPSKDFYLMASL